MHKVISIKVVAADGTQWIDDYIWHPGEEPTLEKAIKFHITQSERTWYGKASLHRVEVVG